MRKAYFILLFLIIGCKSDDEPEVIIPEIVADFSANSLTISEGESVSFTDLSVGEPNTWDWIFLGANSVNSTEQNPTVMYDEAGNYSVTLIASNSSKTDREEKINFIHVKSKPIAYFPLDANGSEIIENIIEGEVSGAVPGSDRDDRPNSAYQFDGIDDNIDFGDVLDLGTSDFTISLWVKVDDYKGLIEGTGSAGSWIVGKGITIAGIPPRAGFAFKTEKIGDENYFQFSIGGQTNEVFSIRASNDYKVNAWYHLVAIRATHQIQLYVDGSLVAERDVGILLDTDTNIPLAFGTINKLGFDPLGTTYYSGAIDEVKIYDKALSANEIVELSHE